MTDADEKKKRVVETREPKKKVAGIFDNLRKLPQAHPVEEILGLVDSNQPSESSTPVPTPVGTGVPTPVATPVYEGRERAPYLDATHTASEKSVYSVMYRETVTKGVAERHFGFKELSEKTGIRSDKTIRVAIDGLIEKLSVEIVTYQHGSPLGPRYRVFDPKEIVKRRKERGLEIDPQSKKIIRTPVPTPVPTGVDAGVATGGKSGGSTPVEDTPVTGVDSTGAYINGFNPLNLTKSPDDEPAAALLSALQEVEREVTGSTGRPEKWLEPLGIVIAELRLAASRASVISSAPAFLAEHLRRRLGKAERQATSHPGAQAAPGQPVAAGKREFTEDPCTVCKGSLMEELPEGGGKRRCTHCRDEVNYPRGREPKVSE